MGIHADHTGVHTGHARRLEQEGTMGRLTPVVVCYVLALVAAVVCVDVVFFRHEFAERLIANVGIVLVFATFYLIFVRLS
jgi:uncharacterized membrane protein